jgi:hypothetical protein
VKILDLEPAISFVVQGGIKTELDIKSVAKCTESIRKFFPRSQIIISTWLENDVSGLDFDKCVISEDPGATIFDDKNQTFQNVNRQIVSSRNGIMQCETKYTIKIRNDLYFTNSNILKWMERIEYINNIEKYPIIGEQPIIVTNVTSVNPRKKIKLPFHPCDWIYAGNTKDLIQIFEIPQMPQSWIRYFQDRPHPENWPEKTYLSRFPAESYIWSSYLKKKVELDFKHGSDMFGANTTISEQIFGSELIVVPLRLLGLKSSKHQIYEHKLRDMYSYSEYRSISKYSAYLPRKLAYTLALATSATLVFVFQKVEKILSNVFWKIKKTIKNLKK